MISYSSSATLLIINISMTLIAEGLHLMSKLSIRFALLPAIAAFLYGCSNEKKMSDIQQQDLPANMLRIAASDDPLALDPRLVRDTLTLNLMHMLFEGLMRIGSDGKLQPALAESVIISPDLLKYTFTLRSSTWSDGTPLTAYDFADTWKSVLTPSFPAPNAYQLYVIKGAKEAKEGRLPQNEIGVSATSPSMLVVTLEQPTPYFLEMLSCHFFYPVHPNLRLHSQTTPMKNVIGNGPFMLAYWNPRDEAVVVKNPSYWDAQAVKLSGIKWQVVDENTALQLFTAGELDWAGSPLSTLPQDAIASLKQQNVLKVAAAAGTHWFRFNTQKIPFDNVKIRKAFALALDRQAIVEHITQGNQMPARGIVPPSLGIENQQYFQDRDIPSAQKLFMAALIDLRDNHQQLPEISLCYSASDRNHKIAQAVQQQWNKAFGINVVIESCEGQVFYDKLKNGTYQISMGSWYADIRDPINFLEVFKTRDTPTNSTGWENERYREMLDLSSKENSSESRLKLLTEAEKTLIDEMPVAPLFYGSFNYLKKDTVQGVYFSELGYLDFKEARLDTE